jgi:hypothetical protein
MNLATILVISSPMIVGTLMTLYTDTPKYLSKARNLILISICLLLVTLISK